MNKPVAPGGPPAVLSVKEWATRVTTEHTLRHRSMTAIFLFCAYGFLTLTTVVIFFLQGFRFKGFNLDVGLLKWLGGATVGEVAGLIALTIKEFRPSV